MFIDSHVHLRDFEESHKETIAHGLRVAEDSGLSGIFDMPNTRPAVTDRKKALERLMISAREESPVFYGLYVGVTSNPDQIREAIYTVRDFFPKPGDRNGVIALKGFAGKSVGDLSNIEEKDQRVVYRTCAEEDYNRVIVWHCEKESEMEPTKWNSKIPISHSFARPEQSELHSIADQIRFALEEGFNGHIHICHVSTPESVNLINEAKRRGLRISCGVTPHHLLLDYDIMEEKDGILYKVNPPLRDPATRKKLFDCFLRGEIDILETDHAPHTLAEKTGKALDKDGKPQYMSGIPGLASWPDFIELLRDRGATDRLIEDMAYRNVNKIFGTQIPRLNLPVKPGAHLGEYAFDAYAGLK